MEHKLDLAHHSGPNSKLHANSSSQAWRYSTGHEAFSRDMVTEEPKTYTFLPNYLDVAYGTQPGKSKAVALLHEKNDATKEKDVKADKDHLHMQLAAPIMPSTTNEFFASPTQVELARHSIACPSFPYSDPYYGGAYPARGPQPLEQYPHGLGVQCARMVLPLEMPEEPVYVNAKQYHGILRRRQSRAKAELERKFIRVRKPYLHESRHLHAMRRARGCGGRFLTTKKPDNTAAKTSTDNHTVGSEHKTMSSNNLFGIADSTSNSQEILFNSHPPNTHSNSNGNNKPYSQVQEFELSSYQSLSGDVRENGGNYSVQQSERFNFNGVLRALTIK